ncbi:insulin-like receptor isoform X2 [Epargyreus clarus]|uniref:insulin-like receptor isoform X2 n=1 Tax=Epargyreus clarus TaxID=520877 RepID=UPI003C30473D
MRRPGSWVAWPAVAFTLLLATECSSAAELAPGVCSSIDIRSYPETMIHKLSGCQVIEGYLSIVLMERVNEPALNMSFPELREVTDFILIYRFVKGVRNLGDLFPNLAVIRGMHLLKDYALVIFDSAGIESLGLRSLTRIERGAVRIQHNDHLCYVNTIDWSRINAEGAENNVIRSNYDTRLCGLCPNPQSRTEDRGQLHLQCPADSSGRLLCWDDKHCQKQCPSACGGRACMEDGACCHATCLGGCSGTGPADCFACANFSFRYGKERTCMERCPANTYELAKRCVTEQECRSMPPPQTPFAADKSQFAPKIKAYKILDDRQCVYTCPSGYTEEGDAKNSICKPCPSCVRECVGTKIDSVAAAESYRGCTRIKGDLEISLRPKGGNAMAVLEAALGEIRVISGCLKVTRSYPLVSLMFLRSLERIGGKCDDNKTQTVLHIFNNPNLELLWDWSIKKLVIETGKLFIHFNPKLCYSQILPLKNMTRQSTFDEIEVSQDNNGNQASCLQETLNLSVQTVHRSFVVLTWDKYCLTDSRKLLGYSVYYLPTENNVTIYGQRDACSDNWNALDIPMDKLQNNTDPVEAKSTKVLTNPCENAQPEFYLLSQLTPYTRYALYVKTYTTLQDQKGAQSAIVYFRTLPGQPSPPLGLTAESVRAHSATIRWAPPALPNGTITSYRIELQANFYNRPKILAGDVNYCGNPSALMNMIALRSEDATGEAGEGGAGEGGAPGGGGGGKAGGNDTCPCREEPAPRFTVRAEEDRQESINFENDLQNLVYIRNKSQKNKVRRSIDNNMKSMLVILSGNSKPMPNVTNVNATDGVKCSRDESNACVIKDHSAEYVKSLYYNLDGSATSLTVDNMRHFTWYTVNIWSCRAQQDNEDVGDYQAHWCSDRAYYTFRTLEKVNADVVRNVDAKILPSNKTLPEVNVTWQPPEDPNGFVVAYNVHYSRVEMHSQDIGLQSCISADDYEAKGRAYLLRNLAPGNYSVRVTPVTLSGAGNVSAELYVLIPERGAGGYAWVWGVVGGCALLLGAAAAAGWYARRALLPHHDSNKLFASVNPEYVSTVYVPDEWEVPRANIEFIRELGQGSFGMVYEGIAKNIAKGKPETRCAVKTVNEHATDRERIEFLNEASVMKAFDTFHVVRLLGVVSRGQPTLVVMELMEFGDLKTYLRSHRPDAESSVPKRDGPPPEPPTLQNILQMAIEIADGMAYLSAKKFVHRDLAARNCMVAGDLTVKVGDFGMTRDIYETDYYRKGTKGLLPVRWMSPESLKDGVFSSNSDIWSYGVVLWEMATLAMQPYQGLSNEQVVRYVVEGGVMERPEHCPDRLYELMRACWAHRAAARPSFLRLVADLAPSAMPHFRHRSFFHSPQGQEMYALQRSALDEEQELQEANVGAVATGSGSNLFGISGRLASWVRELPSLRSRDDDAAAEPLQPAAPPAARKGPPNGVLRERAASTRC